MHGLGQGVWPLKPFASHAGANSDKARSYQPHITSYDYGAPISESGLATPKFAVRISGP